ncbi:hypothetical protein CTV95_19880 [Pectobacterium brasiliense]|nr:hypothetical protein CTV95_19880 [Pectobacterium brasiliense]
MKDVQTEKSLRDLLALLNRLPIMRLHRHGAVNTQPGRQRKRKRFKISVDSEGEKRNIRHLAKWLRPQRTAL